MALPKPRPRKKKKIGDDLVAGVKSFFTGSKKKVPDNKKSPIRKLADSKRLKKKKHLNLKKSLQNLWVKKQVQLLILEL